VNETGNALEEANADLKTAQDNYDAAANRQTVASDAYTKAEADLNAAKAAEQKAKDAFDAAEEDYFNEPNEWNDAAQQQAKDAWDTASATVTKAQQA
ncbi:hypothetical protein DB325_10645, partial [Limosilactobacillus reuteri]